MFVPSKLTPRAATIFARSWSWAIDIAARLDATEIPLRWDVARLDNAASRVRAREGNRAPARELHDYELISLSRSSCRQGTTGKWCSAKAGGKVVGGVSPE